LGLSLKILLEGTGGSFSSAVGQNFDPKEVELTTSALSKLSYYVDGEKI
jgi:hypothetical protein